MKRLAIVGTVLASALLAAGTPALASTQSWHQREAVV